jgi:hypothetical protein
MFNAAHRSLCGGALRLLAHDASAQSVVRLFTDLQERVKEGQTANRTMAQADAAIPAGNDGPAAGTTFALQWSGFRRHSPSGTTRPLP